jgi:hypothetical protein
MNALVYDGPGISHAFGSWDCGITEVSFTMELKARG